MKKLSKRGRNLFWAIGAIVVTCLFYQVYGLISNIVDILDIDNGRFIILSKVFYREGYPQVQIAFDVREDLFSSIGRCTAYFIPPKLAELDEHELIEHEYDLVFADNKIIVGVIDKALISNQPVVMCDFESRKCFPCDVTDVERNTIFEKLKQENPHLQTPYCLEKWMCKDSEKVP